MTGERSYPDSKTAPGEILELFKGGYLSVAETIAALDDLIPTQTEKDSQTAFNLGFRAAGGGCHLPPSAEALFQSWLRDGASRAGREREEEIPATSPAQAPLMQQPQYIIEGIILRRIYEKRIEGYTIEMAKEIAEALAVPSTNQLSPTPEEIAHAETLRGQDLYAWPIGCHSPNSCRRNGRCMYIGCKYDGTTVMSSTDQLCEKCGCETKGEAALVDGEVWCHPCADGCPIPPANRGGDA